MRAPRQFNDAIKVRIDEILPGCRAPVREQQVFYVGQDKRTVEQRIVVEIDRFGPPKDSWQHANTRRSDEVSGA